MSARAGGRRAARDGRTRARTKTSGLANGDRRGRSWRKCNIARIGFARARWSRIGELPKVDDKNAYFRLFFNVHAGFVLAELPKVEMHRRIKNESGRLV